jgi:tetratricopeptide (TPR) repeat protein
VARAEADAPPAEGTEFEVNQERPLGISWTRCADGGIYAKKLIPYQADSRIQVGDKLLEVSASFGDEVWPATSYAQTMYAIKTRVGGIYLKVLARGGDETIFDLEADPSIEAYRKERDGGNYGGGTQQLQTRRFNEAKDLEKRRTALFNEALNKFKAGDYENACIEFEETRALEPKGYVGDRFERVTQLYIVSSYNIACAYSKLGVVDAAKDALEDALSCGFDDYKKVREDPNLETLRQSPKFKKLIDQYDEPLFNSEAVDAFKGLFR